MQDSLIRGLSSSDVNQTSWLTEYKFVKARKISSSSIQIVYTTHYQEKVVNSGSVGKINFDNINNFASRQVNGLADKNAIEVQFAENVAESCSLNCYLHNAQLKADYGAMTNKYVGIPYSYDNVFDVELLEEIITELNNEQSCWVR